MKAKSILAVLLLIVAGLQTAWGQGFRVYKSDGTYTEYSVKADSLVFDENIANDKNFGVFTFTPVNNCLVGTWYDSQNEAVTFGDGTTDFAGGPTFEFMPFQGTLIVYGASGSPSGIFRVYKMTDEMLILGPIGSGSYSVLTRERQPRPVTGITLSQTSLSLRPNEIATLTATVVPADADNMEVEWASSDEAVAEVNRNGRVIANANGTCTITCSAKDGSGVKAECQVTVTSGTTPDPGNHAWVDLGLPSGTLWATCNVGASSPEEYGLYFAWGETQPKNEYNWSTYKWCNGSYDTMTKYCTQSSYGYNGFTDNKTELDPADDAATANWGSGWQMPSLAQLLELCSSSYTTTEWTQVSGVNGHKITSKSNGNSLFLPAAGYRYDTSLHRVGSSGYYWSRSLDASNSSGAYNLYFSSGGVNWDDSNRNDGQSVRPVRVQN